MRNKGFTMIEILFVVAIVSIVSAIVFISLSKLNSTQALRESSALVTSVLNEARSLTISSKSDSQYGVHFEDYGVVLFKGDSYSPIDPTNISTEINSLIGIGNINFSDSGTDIVFKRLTGEALVSGTLELFLKASPETKRVITISNTGLVDSDL
ncbi:MAG: hypothetical protein CO183_02635 [Candidatus Zambryskibacteria bacterium CG_4_9_14_3_um_filter_42_9]|uniref:General secretion pathway GspH domain-containing protein n=1 Tax=Candidatus Zambryskibacteria bacterium CG22_combo_CG10-13_8_21_14_all_42_17 TaxID=1975118 RepID=A0A2H0BDE1_9BACT|nr:MAG: hypothetical protein COX06_01890 [Candidatus Zambryskibacteria bacterium CG22_combo_CG10-13_8_21_14_all_42_17]PJA36613.1 MAG: hypothetical protein CO183_02635 [Candidatus Zambryskibacteria bacterium CG_4_9_14_3_um_filter_42_9]